MRITPLNNFKIYLCMESSKCFFDMPCKYGYREIEESYRYIRIYLHAALVVHFPCVYVDA